MTQLRWLLVVAASAYACRLAVHHATPVDEALPMIGLIIALVAAVSHAAVMTALPMLIVCEIAIPNEHLRLLSFGLVVAAALVTAMLVPERLPGERRSEATESAPFIVAAAVILLRWIPLDGLLIGRELVVLALAVAIVLALGRTPFAVIIAVATALFTPAIPLRTLAIPLVVLIAVVAARTVGMPTLRLTWPSSVALACVMLFFAWSGVLARASGYFVRGLPAEEREMVDHALRAGETSTLDVPDAAIALIVSGANVATLRQGTPLGLIEPGAVELRIGDVADWGFLRREEFASARNRLPRNPAGRINGHGYAAWVDGAGRIALPPGARMIRVTADHRLPAGAVLQVEAFEMPKR